MRKGAYRTKNSVSTRREMTGKVIFLSLAAFVLVGSLGLISRAAAPDPAAMRTLREADAARAAVVNATVANNAIASTTPSAPARALQARGAAAKATPTSAPPTRRPCGWRRRRGSPSESASAVDETDADGARGRRHWVTLDAASDPKRLTRRQTRSRKPQLKKRSRCAESREAREPSTTAHQRRNVCVHGLDRRPRSRTCRAARRSLLAADMDDTASALAPIGFDFWFDGVRQTLVLRQRERADEARRRATSRPRFEQQHRSARPTNPQIAPYWDDLWIGNNGRVHYKVVGTAPNRKLVVEWKNEQIPRVATATAGAGNFPGLALRIDGRDRVRLRLRHCGQRGQQRLLGGSRHLRDVVRERDDGHQHRLLRRGERHPDDRDHERHASTPSRPTRPRRPARCRSRPSA